jgi:hypothetical protein
MNATYDRWIKLRQQLRVLDFLLDAREGLVAA